MDEIHEDVFDCEMRLSVRDRCDFIELFYTRLIEYLLIKTKATSYNLTCKDGIDRGIGACMLLYLYLYLRQGKPVDLLKYEEIEEMAFSPALLVRQREIKLSRLERMLSAFRKISKKEVLEKLQKRLENKWDIKELFVK
jgi:hypothetical protein